MPKASVRAAGEIIGDRVTNITGEELGWIDDVVVDIDHNRLAYAVLAFDTRQFGSEGKRFAVPWTLLRLADDGETFLLDVERDVLERAPGFEQGDIPDYADREWGHAIHGHFGEPTYW